MTDPAKPFAFSQFVPGFDFLRSLTGGGSGGAVPGLPGLSNWVAPTLSVEELDKRIDELKTVQYWLEQNGHALKATIQALEVQKMTLSTLKGMNVQMEDLANAFARSTTEAANAMREAASSAVAPAPAAAPVPAAAQPEAAEEDAHADEPEAPETAEAKPAARSKKAAASADGGPAPAPGVIDPLQWWNSLTQQFQQIASNAMQEAAQMHAPGSSSADEAAPKPASKRTRRAAPAGPRASAPRSAASKRAPAAKSRGASAKRSAGNTSDTPPAARKR